MAKSISRRLADSASPTGAIDGTLSTAAQTNITSVGTLSALTVSGDLTVDTSTLKVDSTNNRVGIGTSSPSYPLEVAGAAGDSLTITARSGDATAANNAGGGFRNIGSATATSRSAQMWLDADGANLSGGDYFYIEKKGNSGDVIISQYSNADMIFQVNAGAERMRIASDGTISIPNQNAINEISFTGTEFTNVLSATTSGFELGTTGAGYLRFLTNNTERMRIDSAGNVGIGTASPNSYSGYTALTLNHATNGGILDFEFNGNLQGEIYANSANLGLGLQAVGNRSIDLRTNGTLRATIDGSGNFGIGVVPSAWPSVYAGALQMKGGSLFTATTQTYLTHNLVYTTAWKAINTSASTSYLQSAGVHQWFTFPSASAGATATPSTTNVMILSANGGLGLGTTDATDAAWGSAANNTEFAIDGNAGYGVIHLRGTGSGSTDTRYSIGCGDSKLYLAYDDIANVHRVQVHGTEVEITNSSTNYALKITTPHGFAQIGALNSTYLHNDTDRSINYWSKTCQASGGFHTYSDERLKENITPIDSALSKVEQMNGVTFTWIDPARGGGNTGKQFGVIAQNMAAIDSELPSILPDPLETDENINDASKDTDYYTMDYTRITPFLIEAIKELKEELNTATARITELENN